MSRTGHVRSLDGVRGLAIAAVMLYHGWTYTGHGDVGLAIDRARSIGWAGVDLFFVLSGFLITGILLETRSDPRYWRNFLIRRGLRIFPLYYAVLLVIVLGAIAVQRIGAGDTDPALFAIGGVWINFLYITNFAIAIVGENHVPLDIAWSLAIEEQFYLLYPWLVRRVQPRTLLIILLCAIAAAPIARGLVWLWGAQPVLGPYVLPYCRWDALALGAVIRVLLVVDRVRIVALAARLAPVAGLVALVILYAWTRKDPRFIVVGYTTTAIAGACLLARLITAPPGAWVTRVFENPVLVYLGKISYGLYLFHLLARFAATFVLARAVGHKYPGEAWFCALQMAGMFAIAIGVAALSFRFFERPLLAFKDRLAPVRRA